MSTPSTAVETALDPTLESFRDALIDTVEHGSAAVEKALGSWCARHPELARTFRDEARAMLLLWGLREPERLGPYQLLDVLTTGGMGKIYRAKENVTGRIVVVKTSSGHRRQNVVWSSGRCLASSGRFASLSGGVVWSLRVVVRYF